MTQVITAPEPLAWPAGRAAIFLAGSIEMGAAPPWQAAVARHLEGRELVLLDPRRAAWDASWRQDITEERFREQVEWELAGLERADLVVMYFAPPTRSPVTLLELGLCARSGRLLVACPEGFWRRGNVQVVCARYGVPLLDSLEALLGALDARYPP